MKNKLEIAYLLVDNDYPDVPFLNNVFADVVYAHLKQAVKDGHALRVAEKYSDDKIIKYSKNDLETDDLEFVGEFVNDVFGSSSIAMDEQEGIYLADRDSSSLALRWEGYRHMGTRNIHVSKLHKSIDEIASDIYHYLLKQNYSLNDTIFMKVLHSNIYKNRVYFGLNVDGTQRDVSFVFNESEHGFSISDPFDQNNIIASFGTGDYPLHHTSFFVDRDLDGVDSFFVITDKLSSYFESKWHEKE